MTFYFLFYYPVVVVIVIVVDVVNVAVDVFIEFWAEMPVLFHVRANGAVCGAVRGITANATLATAIFGSETALLGRVYYIIHHGVVTRSLV